MSMSNIIQETWTIIVAGIGGLAAIVIFCRNILTVRKLQFEVAKLKTESLQKDSIIKIANTEEIERYGKSINRWNGTIVLMISISLSSLMLPNLPNKQSRGPATVGNQSPVITSSNGNVVIDNSVINSIQPVSIIKFPNLDDEIVLSVDLPGAVVGEISKDKPISWFRFDIKKHIYVKLNISVEEGLDTVMYLYGPNEIKHFIKKDDDGGDRKGSKIILPLSPGLYFIAVNGFDDSTGRFKFQIDFNTIKILNIGETKEVSLQEKSEFLDICFMFDIKHYAIYGFDMEPFTSDITVMDEDFKQINLSTFSVGSKRPIFSFFCAWTILCNIAS